MKIDDFVWFGSVEAFLFSLFTAEYPNYEVNGFMIRTLAPVMKTLRALLVCLCGHCVNGI
jgi:hypothetical protein